MLRKLGAVIGRELASVRRGAASRNLLDFGCGSMPYRSIVEAQGFSYAGADFESPTLSISPSGALPIADAGYDAVLSVQVLEHVRDLDRYLAEAARVLKDDGTLLLSTHGAWLYHPHPEDHRRWTRTGLILDIEARGFVVQTVEALVGPLATTTLIRLTGFAFVLRRLPLIGSPIAALLTMVMNLRGWLEDRITPAALIRDNACIYVVRCVKASV
ncbi:MULTISPECIES: class I SAM-dependent methyltransferase [Sphingomonas]|uniref:Class I SAM-dependent methyltransferase n=1 Tax=Sphingomonas kyungheensis TaxID=1069987 RepID=A0ABU8H7S8_9SPHN|nr:class I SAM-dependent methyltransferase [Sphingomonas sp. CV7422]